MAFIRIDPQLPVVWRSPHTIQIGSESPVVVLDAVSERDERMLAAARAGIPAEALAAVGRCSGAEAMTFLDLIRPVLVGRARASRRIASVVRVRSAARSEIARTLQMLGVVGQGRPERPEVGVIVADHAVPLRAYRDWIRDSVPHFAVVFGARAATVGPLVVPGVTGCLRCADLHRLALDPAWPAVASQLVDLPAATALDPLVRTETLCRVARLAASIGQVDDIPGLDASIDPHPQCGCTLDLVRTLPPVRESARIA